MNQQQGFSLVEVLASLLLITSLSFSLLQQQLQSKQLIRQLIQREHHSQSRDQDAERLLVQGGKNQ